MSGRSGYGNGYGYDTGRYEQGDSSYGGSNSSGGNGYRGGNTGGSRRPGGYGEFYPESSQRPSVPSVSPERRRERSDQERQQPSSQSTSRSRTRNGDAGTRYQGPRDAARYAGSQSRDRNGTGAGALAPNSRERQSIEGLLVIPPTYWVFLG